MTIYRTIYHTAIGLLPAAVRAETETNATDVSFWQILIVAAVGYYIYRKIRPRQRKSRPVTGDDRLAAWSQRTKVLWAGAPRDIEFTYGAARGSPARRHVGVTCILRDPEHNRIYLKGMDRDSNEERTFNLDAITTKILDHGRRYDADDWVEKLTGAYPF